MDEPEGLTKYFVNGATGAVVGAVYGGIVSAWVAPHATNLEGVALAEEALPSLSKMWRHVGGNAAVFAATATAFTVGESAVVSMRGESDLLSSAAGGFAAGLFVGSVRAPKISHAFGFGTGFAAVSSLVYLSHGFIMQDKERVEKRLLVPRR